VYEWNLGVGMGQEPDSTKKDTYAVGMLFTSAVAYTLEVEHLTRDEELVERLIDVDYESDDPEDKYTEILAVFPV
jgi:hypothetical protein